MESSIVSSVSLDTGLAALHQGRYQEAIGSLEAFCHDCAVQAKTASHDYLRAQMHLVKVYEQQGHPDRAIALCHQLSKCSNAQVQIWAQQYLRNITKAEPLPLVSPALPGFTFLRKLKFWF